MKTKFIGSVIVVLGMTLYLGSTVSDFIYVHGMCDAEVSVMAGNVIGYSVFGYLAAVLFLYHYRKA